MLKKVLLLLLSFLLCFSVCACSGNGTQNEETTDGDGMTDAADTSDTSETDTSESTEETTDNADSGENGDVLTYPWGEAPKSLKILAIGNSFSTDAMEYLYQIAKSAGVEEVVLGNLYIGGCSLETHLQHAVDDDEAYTYYKNTTGSWTGTANTKFSAGLADEDWDVITLQQTSKTSGLPATYGETLLRLLACVEHGKTNSEAKLMWHMTWAYQQDSTHASFPNYNSDQMTMYNMIVETTKDCILTVENFDGVIPNATSIQNARTGFVGDNLTRDGYHLNKTLGRYIAALTYFAAITGADISDIAYIPSSDITADVMALAKDSVKDAMKNPYGVTRSVHTEGTWGVADGSYKIPVDPEDCYESDQALAASMGVNLDDYVLLEYDYIENGYYKCTGGTDVTYPKSSASTYHENICSAKIYSKTEIPENSILICDLGWQFRPELWVSLDAKAASRPGISTAAVTLMDTAFWGSNNYFAFNLSSNPKGDISEFYDAAASHFRIYVPKASVSGSAS